MINSKQKEEVSWKDLTFKEKWIAVGAFCAIAATIPEPFGRRFLFQDLGAGIMFVTGHIMLMPFYVVTFFRRRFKQ